MRKAIAYVAVVCAVVVAAAAASAAISGFDPFGSSQVGQQVGDRILLPDNQWISPVGNRSHRLAAAVSG